MVMSQVRTSNSSRLISAAEVHQAGVRDPCLPEIQDAKAGESLEDRQLAVLNPRLE